MTATASPSMLQAIDVTQDTGQIVQLPAAQLHANPWNRKKFDQAKLKELAASIAVQGVLQPVVVRVRPKGGYEIVAGERRWRASVIAKQETVPAVVRVLTDLQVVEIMATENAQREDPHPLEEAEQYAWLLAHSQGKYDREAIADKVGKSLSYIHQRLKLAELVPEAKKAFQEDRLTAGHAILVARLQPADQKDILKRIVGDRHNGSMSVRELARWIEQEVHRDLHSAPFTKDDAQLVPKAGACTVCPKRTGFTPALFPDIAKKDTCTDGACFKQKMAAHLAQRHTALAKEGKVVWISSSYGPGYREEKKPGAFYSSAWKKAAAGSCHDTVTGLYFDGMEIGKSLTVCIGTNCKKHRERWEQASSYRSENSTWQRQEKARQQKARREGTRRRRIFTAVIEKLPTTLGQLELREVIDGFVNEMHHATRKLLCEDRGWTGAKNSYGGWNYEKTIAREAAKLKPAQLTQLLLMLPLVRDLEVPSYGSSAPSGLLAAAKRYKVNTRAIDRVLAAEERARAKKQKAAKAKAKKKSAKKGKKK